MGLGDLTRQFAQEAILDTLRPADAAQDNGDNPAATIIGQIQAMQRALKEEDELLIVAEAAGGAVRVFEIFLPTWRVAVLTGVDPAKALTRVITPVERLQMTCKVVRAAAGQKPGRIKIVTPKAAS